MRQRLWSEFAHAQPGPGAGDAALAAWRDELRLLGDARIAARWLDALAGLLHACPPRSTGEIGRELLGRGRAVIFEGAQGLLLDEWHGFHPHTTWSSTGPAAALQVAHELGLCGASGVEREMRHFGVLRTYLTRHGTGPLPTHDSALDRALAEPHNADDGWQGPFRRGHPDAVLLRYAAQAAGRLDGLLLSHLDAVERPHGGLRWCTGYQVAPHEPHQAIPGLPDEALCERDAQGVLLRLKPSAPGDLRHQEALGHLLARARPVYHADTLRSADEAVRRIAEAAGCPVPHGSFGPRAEDVRDLRTLGGGVSRPARP